MDGVGATRTIRRAEQARGAGVVPMLAVTAHARQEYRDQAIAAGCDGYLSKPVRMQSLLAAVATALGCARPRRTIGRPVSGEQADARNVACSAFFAPPRTKKFCSRCRTGLSIHVPGGCNDPWAVHCNDRTSASALRIPRAPEDVASDRRTAAPAHSRSRARWSRPAACPASHSAIPCRRPYPSRTRTRTRPDADRTCADPLRADPPHLRDTRQPASAPLLRQVLRWRVHLAAPESGAALAAAGRAPSGACAGPQGGTRAGRCRPAEHRVIVAPGPHTPGLDQLPRRRDRGRRSRRRAPGPRQAHGHERLRATHRRDRRMAGQRRIRGDDGAGATRGRPR